MSEPVRDDVRALLDAVAERGGSDLLFAPGRPPTARVDGELVAIGDEPLSPADTEAFARALTGARWDELVLRREVDFSFSLGAVARIRANIFYQRGTLAGALRLVPYVIPEPGSARRARHLRRADPSAPWPRARDGPDGGRQVDDAGGDDRPGQPRSRGATSSPSRTRSSTSTSTTARWSSSARSASTRSISPAGCEPRCEKTPTSCSSVRCVTSRRSRSR